MKTVSTFPGFVHVASWLNCQSVFFMAMSAALTTSAQGTVTFDARPYFSGTVYSEVGMGFHVVVPTPGTGSPNHDSMVTTPAVISPSNIPYNSTPYMAFFQQFSPDDYVSLSLTNGAVFGLTSVWLADPSSPSQTQLPITFRGYKTGGLIVTTTFTTPGAGADHLQAYQFEQNFASGLTSVDILASRWAMDNLVFDVPEPGGLLVFGLGVLALAARRLYGPRKS